MFIFVAFVAGCPTTNERDEPSLKSAYLVRLAPDGSEESAGNVLNIPHLGDGASYEVELQFEAPLLCTSTGRLAGTLIALRPNDGEGILLTEHRCVDLPTSTRVRIPVDRVVEIPSINNRFANFGLTFISDGNPDTVDSDGVPTDLDGTVTYRFWVSAERPSGVRPHFSVVLPHQSAPGFDRPISPSDIDTYLSNDGIVAPEPIEPHAQLSFAGDPASSTQMLVAYSLTAAPLGADSDIGVGVVPQTFRTTIRIPFGTLRARTTGRFDEVASESEVGLVPGVRYDFRFIGARGLADPTLGTTQSATGDVLEPWLDPLIAADAAIRNADARYLIETHALRVEYPTASPIGRRDVGLSADAPTPSTPDPTLGTLRVRFIVPTSHPLVGDVETMLSDSATGISETSYSPLASLGSMPSSINQAGRDWPMVLREVSVPVPTSTVDTQTIRVSVSITDPSGDETARDTRGFDLDLVPPVVVPAVCPLGQPGPNCTTIDDPDERDCRLGRVCVPVAGSPDITQVEITHCGVTRVFDLGEASSDGIRCTVDPLVFEGGTNTPHTVSFRTVDDAGNFSLPSGEAEPPCFPAPPRDSAVDNSFLNSTLAGRDATGRPVRVRTSNDALIVERWDGTRWNADLVSARGTGFRYRGRLGRAVASDGTIVFCGTSRPMSSDDPSGHTLRGDLRQRGYLDVGVIGGAGASVVASFDVRALGCALAPMAPSDDGTERFALAYSRIVSRSSVDQMPSGIGLAVCELLGDQLECEPRVDPRFTTLQALALEPDVAVTADGSILLAGRGFVPTSGPSSGLFREHGLYYLRVPPSATGAVNFVPVVDEASSYCYFDIAPFGPDSAASLAAAGGAHPRLVTSGARVGLVAWHYTHDISSAGVARSETSLSFWQLSPRPFRSRTVLQIRERSTGPAFERFSEGVRYADPPLTPSPCLTPLPVTPRQFDVVTHADGFDIVAAFDSDVSRNEPRVYNLAVSHVARPATPSPDVASFDAVSGLRGITLNSSFARVGTSQLLDVDVGEALGVSAWRDSVRGELSATYYRAGQQSEGLTYAEERAGQFIIRQGGVDTNSCAQDQYSRSVLSLDEMSLRPNRDTRYLGNAPETTVLPAAFTSVRMGSAPEVAYSNLSAQFSCLMNNAMESQLVVDGSSESVDDRQFNRAVRHPVASSYLSWLSGFSPDVARPASLYSRRFEADDRFTGRTITLREPAIRRVTLPSRSRTGAELARDLDTALGGTPRRPRVALYRIGAAPDEDEVDARQFRFVLLNWPACDSGSTCRATLRVDGGNVAAELGLPLGQRATSPLGLDLAEGDRYDRTRPSVRHTPCTTGEDGTCGLPEDFLPLPTSSTVAAGGARRDEQNLLWSLFSDLELAMGRPPLRRQQGVCIPEHQQSNGPDVCSPTTAVPYRDATAADYSGFAQRTATDLSCPPGEEFSLSLSAGAQCFSCGPSTEVSPDDPTSQSLPMGSPRRCQVDDECQTASSATRPAPLLCTRLTRDFMGVPAGQGFCAEPPPCPSPGSSSCFTREVPGAHQTRSVEIPRAGPVALPGRDFLPRPFDVACVLTGCIACVGDIVNGVCTADSECPEDHRCLLSEGAMPDLRTPACIMRPFASDPRLRDAIRTTAMSSDPGARTLSASLRPTLLSIQDQLLASLTSLSLPARQFVDRAGTRVEANTLHVALRGATMTVRDVPTGVVDIGGRRTVGPHELVLTVLTRGPLTVGGRAQWGIFGGGFNATASIRAIEARFVPSVSSDGQLRLRYRGVRLLQESVVAGDVRDAVLGPAGISFDADEGLGTALDLFSVESGFYSFISATVGSVFGALGVVASEQINIDPAGVTGLEDLGGLGPVLARIIQLVREQPLLGALFGIDLASTSFTGGVVAQRLENTAAWPASSTLETIHRGRLLNVGLAVQLLSRTVPGTCGPAVLGLSQDQCGCLDSGGSLEPTPDCLESPGAGSLENRNMVCTTVTQALCSTAPTVPQCGSF